MATKEEVADSLLNDSDYMVRLKAVQAGLANTDILKAAKLSDSNEYVRNAMIQVIDTLTADQLESALTDSSYNVKMTTIKRFNADMTQAQIDRAVIDSNAYVRKTVCESLFTRLSAAQKDTLLNDSDKMVATTMAKKLFQ